MRLLGVFTGISLLYASVVPSGSLTSESQEAVETARLLALLLDAGRLTVARNQDLINDPAKGDKGFTPEVFEAQLDQEFRERTGVTLAGMQTEAVPPMARPLLGKLLEESKKTIAYHQVVINIPGVRYKGLIPATFGTETAQRFQKWSGVYLKQTAPQRLVRNPNNAPDTYEADVLTRIAARPSESSSNGIISEVMEGGRTIRLLLPLFYGKSCLGCHGEPKGERDISGYPKEGAKEGDLGGAISVKISLK
ncbi:MAG TPA: DUF3365 domain-containing protein [Nitrospira sp.]|nr:DUF3365 domain-containing protein [Nitrospira sp.]